MVHFGLDGAALISSCVRWTTGSLSQVDEECQPPCTLLVTSVCMCGTLKTGRHAWRTLIPSRGVWRHACRMLIASGDACSN